MRKISDRYKKPADLLSKGSLLGTKKHVSSQEKYFVAAAKPGRDGPEDEFFHHQAR